MRRREFITLIGGAAVWSLGALAQQPDRKRRIGVLMNLAENQEGQARITAFRQALEQFSWTDRGNVQIEIRWAGGDADRYRDFAAELVALVPDVILATGTPAVEALQRAIATIIGVETLIATASGVFGEMQAALNSIWKTKPQATTMSRLIRARAISLGLVAALGFLLIVSLVISAGLTAFGNYLDIVLPMGKLVLPVLNFVVSVTLLAILFGAIYKMLPDRSLQWNDVINGALITSVLFNIGKSLIAWYIGSSAIASIGRLLALKLSQWKTVFELPMEALWNSIDAWLGLSAVKAEELSTLQVCLRALIVYLVLIGYVAIREKAFSQRGHRF